MQFSLNLLLAALLSGTALAGVVERSTDAGLAMFIPATAAQVDKLTQFFNETNQVVVFENPGLYCDTTTGSPTVGDLVTADSKLELLPANAKCEQGNNGGSRCTRTVNSGTAALGVCGAYGVWINCHDMASLIADSITPCQWNGLSGFHYRLNDNLRLIAYHN